MRPRENDSNISILLERETYHRDYFSCNFEKHCTGTYKVCLNKKERKKRKRKRKMKKKEKEREEEEGKKSRGTDSRDIYCCPRGPVTATSVNYVRI